MTDARFVREPVGWLLGPELISKLRKILRKRSDPRNWMPYYRGCVHDECWYKDGRLVRVVAERGHDESAVPGAPERLPAAGDSGAERATQPGVPEVPPSTDELWFDYVADTGDSADSMYAVAYAAMVSFDGDATRDTWTAGADRKPLQAVRAGEPAKLPRGQFLFVGGDTAYHVADAPTLQARVQEPFAWAYEDAGQRGHVAPHASADVATRRIYGIPGNHDWYDNLEGFSLIFRLGSPPASPGADAPGPILLPDLERVQLASYVAIQLPHGWQLWGLDIDSPMDRRQEAYFDSLRQNMPDRIIVATPSPAIVFGASVAVDHHRDAVRKLGIAIPEVPVTASRVSPAYRLDPSGDVHHYARYYPRDGVATYGSVVSGLGGAFHHPSFTRATCTAQRVAPVRMYPTVEQSRTRIGERLLTPASTWFGSWARVIPFVLTLICGFAATRSVGGGWLLGHLLSLVGFTARPSIDGGHQVLHALCALAAFVVAATGLYAAIQVGRAVYARQIQQPASVHNIVDLWNHRELTRRWFASLFSWHRSYWFAWAIAGVAIAPFVLYPLWGPESYTLGLDLAALIVVGVLPIAGAIAGAFVGGKYVGGGSKLLVGFVGWVHAAAHVMTALLAAQLFTVSAWSVAAAIAAYAVVAGTLHLARPMFQRDGRTWTAALGGLALAVLLAAFAIIVLGARGDQVMPSAGWWDMLRYALSGVMAMPFGTAWFVWYLAVAGRLDAHNNEVGGAARVTSYRELIRFRVAADGLTGYVIAVENATADRAARVRGQNLRFELVDVFTIPTPRLEQQSQVPGQAGFGDLESGIPTTGEER